MNPTTSVFDIFNTATQTVVARRSTKQRARSTRDRLDMSYGASVHVIREVVPPCA